MKKLEITKNPNLYAFREMKTYNDYDNYLKMQADQRRDRHLNMRTDDIQGAQYKKFYTNKYGKKISNFFPNVPDANNFYN